MTELTDPFQRTITYLRVSVTDRCNFRCVYCMPAEGVPWRPHEEILTYEEIAQVVEAGARLGIRKVRLTGGEPLVRRALPELVSRIAAIPGIDDLSLTTNAARLPSLAAPLAAAGLRRVNISIDTLDPQKFSRITRGGRLEDVWAGIAAAEDAGLTPIKLNVVVVRGVNDDELETIARLALDHPWHVRFIEFMPVANGQDWGAGFPAAGARRLSLAEMQERLSALRLRPAAPDLAAAGPARLYQIPGGLGVVGFISPVSEHFCGQCNRLRLTADGSLRPCLLNQREIPLRDALRRGEDITPLLQRAVGMKPEGHTLSQTPAVYDRKMAQIGG